MSMRKEIKIGLGVVTAVIIFTILANLFGIIKIEGNEAGVRQHFLEGVMQDVYKDGTHFYFPGIAYDVYKYNIGTQKITFDNSQSNPGAEYPRIIVNVGEGGGQEARIAASVNYRIGHERSEKGIIFSPGKLVALHKDGIGKTYQDVVLKRTIVDVVNQVARPRNALDIYSGTGFVEFKESIDKQLKNHPVFQRRGIVIENTIVYKVYLDPNYESEIASKQLAIQAKLRKVEETKAAEEEALRVRALAQAEVESRTQKAEATKIERIKAAEAEKAEQVLKAEGNKESDILKAEGVLALGKAQAEVEALKRDALYDGESGKRRAHVEIETNKAQIYKNMLTGATVLTDKSIARLGEVAGVASTGTMIPVD